MLDAAQAARRPPLLNAQSAVSLAAALWFTAAFAGQMIFAIYIAAFYGGAVLQGNLEAWNARLIIGLVDGDWAGNAALGVHLLLAGVITVCGPLQFIPEIRRRAIRFHRWNGRIYITAALVISVGAAWMIITRGAGGFDATAILVNAALIAACAAMTLRCVLAGKMDAHRRWALRTFLLVSGVWFLRIGYAFLGMLFQGRPPGVSDGLDGPTDVALAYLSFILPLGLLQLYFLSRDQVGAAGRYAMAGLLVLVTIATGLGVLGMTLGAWGPQIFNSLGA